MAARQLALKPDPLAPTSPITALSPPAEGPLTKQYVIPPRPKPGRKPATDTPPTKRKAQNRAAQRAFRERRAAKVHELEDEMREDQVKHEATIAALNDEHEKEVRRLEAYYQNELKATTARLVAEQGRIAHLESQLALRANAISDEEAQRSYQTPPAVPDGCGNCTAESRCQCVEDAFEVNVATGQEHQHISSNTIDDTEMEIDFTNMGVPSSTLGEEVIVTRNPALESCGFCSDDSICICAQMEADRSREEHQPHIKQEFESSPAPLQSSSSSRPHPSTCSTDPAVSLICRTARPHGKRLPLHRSQLRSVEPCALGESCCRVSNTLETTRAPISSSKTGGTGKDRLGPTLSCSEAFNALQNYEHWPEASSRQELQKWIPMLKMVPKRSDNGEVLPPPSSNTILESRQQGNRSGKASAGDERRTSSTGSLSELMADKSGFEIEAASVLSVLQFMKKSYD